MPHHYGQRAKTRHMFSRAFRQHGPEHLSTYLTIYKVGDWVDIKANGAIHKGMPYKFYHGRTGRVWNVTKRAVGVEIIKTVGNRKILKRIHVRIEHVRHSRCREDFLKRVKENERLRNEAKKEGKSITLKRQPGLPKSGETIDAASTQIETLRQVKYEFLA